MTGIRRMLTAAAVLAACLVPVARSHAGGHERYPGPSSLYPEAAYWTPTLYRVWACWHGCYTPLYPVDHFPCLPFGYTKVCSYPVPLAVPHCQPYVKPPCPPPPCPPYHDCKGGKHCQGCRD